MGTIAAASLNRPIRSLGRSGERWAREVGRLASLLGGVFMATVRGKVALRDVLDQAYAMGVQSVPLVMITGALSGVVTTQQGGYQFTGSIPLYVLGSVVTSSIILELGPVMTAFVLIGRVGARIAAELGTMRVSEQLDALESLGRDPVRVLAAPRILAGIVMTPLLVAIADSCGMIAGLVSGNVSVGLAPDTFLYGVRLYWHSWDLFYSLTKGLAFGFVIPVISTHAGFATRGGAEGVGRSTTTAVVTMIITVLVLDALFPPLLLQ